GHRLLKMCRGVLINSTLPSRVCLGLLLLLAAPPLRAADVDYTKEIKPLLAHKCTACHGPLKQEAGLRLDAGQLIHRGSDDGKVVVANNSGESRILEKVT